LNVGRIEPQGTPMVNANDRSGVIRFAQAERGIPGPAGRVSAMPAVRCHFFAGHGSAHAGMRFRVSSQRTMFGYAAIGMSDSRQYAAIEAS
jgi:hypothetical protein